MLKSQNSNSRCLRECGPQKCSRWCSEQMHCSICKQISIQQLAVRHEQNIAQLSGNTFAAFRNAVIKENDIPMDWAVQTKKRLVVPHVTPSQSNKVARSDQGFSSSNDQPSVRRLLWILIQSQRSTFPNITSEGTLERSLSVTMRRTWKGWKLVPSTPRARVKFLQINSTPYRHMFTPLEKIKGIGFSFGVHGRTDHATIFNRVWLGYHNKAASSVSNETRVGRW